jgi:hypothetical protein
VATRLTGRTPEEWHELGRQAILDLLNDRIYSPWGEVEARISDRRWKGFPPIQPLQLGGARRTLEEEGLILPDVSAQNPPVVGVRIPFPEGRKREFERLRGRRRKAYRKYLGWAGDQSLCGKHAERVVLDSLHDAASAAGLFVPPQTVGRIEEVRGIRPRGPLDALAYILDLPDAQDPPVPLVIEVKNIRGWVYPYTQELWELLVKAAEIAQTTEVMPILTCVRTAYQTGQMARDTGFLAMQLWDQLFSPSIPSDEFQQVKDEFALPIMQHEGSHPNVKSFPTKVLRSRPTGPPPEDIEWYRRQIDRFREISPVILRFDALAGDLDGPTRRSVFGGFRSAARATMAWPSVGGW